jgi:hypothetical protein
MASRRLRFAARIAASAIVFAAAGCSTSPRSGEPTTSAASSSAAGAAPGLLPLTPWQQELAKAGPDGSRSVDSALRLFAMAFGPIPGVDAQPPAAGSIDSATPAVEAIRGHLAELSAEQRAAVLQDLSPKTQGDPIEVPAPGSGAAGAASAERSGTGGAGVAVARGSRDALGGSVVLAAALSDIRTEVVADATKAWSAATSYYGNLGINLSIQFVDLSDPSFRTYLDFGDLRANCVVDVDSSAWDGVATRRALTLDVVHCFQDAFEGAIADAAHRHFEPGGEGLWNTWGAAEYITSALWPLTTEDSQAWLRYVLMPDIPLFEREEDAVGFYAQAKHNGLDLASVMKAILIDPSEGESTVGTETAPDRFAAAGAATPDFLKTWAPELAEESWGHDWTFAADWPTPNVETPRQSMAIAVGGTEAVSQPAYSNHLYALNSSADIVLFDFEGFARISDGSVDDANLAPAYFCTTAKGCGPCPDGSSPSVHPARLAPASILAVSGGTDGTTGTVSGHALEEFCNASPPPSQAVQVQEIFTIFGERIPRVNLLSCDGPYGHWTGTIYGVLTYSRPMDFTVGGSGDRTVTVTPADAHLPENLLSVSGDVDVTIQDDGTTMVLSGVTNASLRGPNGPVPLDPVKFSLAYQIMPADPGRCP